MEKCNVGIMVYSLTGNTHHAATKIASGLEAQRGTAEWFETRMFNIVALIRAKYFKDTNNDGDAEEAKLAEFLQWANVIGCGVLCVAGLPPAGVSQLLSELPRELVQGKPAFVFTTAGQHCGTSNKHLADSLLHAGVAKIVSEFEMMPCPDTWVWCLPSKPRKFAWGTNVIETATQYGNKLALELQQFFKGEDRVYARPSRKLCIRTAAQDKRIGSMIRRISVPEIECDISKCVKCAVCAKACPSASITLVPGKTSPVWNHKTCLGCTACVAKCPRDALSVRNMSHRQFWVFNPANIKEGDNNWSIAIMRWWVVKSLMWRLASSKKVIAFILIVTVLMLMLKYTW